VSDLFLFLAGTIVTLMVAAVVFLLMWGAAHEPRPGEAFERPSDRQDERARDARIQFERTRRAF
jgi:hypothetical protein